MMKLSTGIEDVTVPADREAFGMVVYSSAGQSRVLPAAVVLDVAPARPAAPLPFAPTALEGLVETDGRLAPQWDLPQAMGGAARAGRCSMLIATTRGPIRVRVDAVSVVGSAREPAPDLPSGLAAIEALAATLAPADTVPVLAPEAATAIARPLEVLLVASHGLVLALPALGVEQVARHQGTRALRTGHPGERVVVIGNDLLPGWSLSAWLGQAPAEPQAEEGWAVILRGDGGRTALTVAEVRGLVSVPADRVRRLSHRNGATLWLSDPGRGAIEVIEPAGVAGLPVGVTDPVPDAALPPPTARPERRSADRGLLAATVGPFTCVFPVAMVAEVLGTPDRRRWSAWRSRNAWPVLDPALLLGLPGPDAASSPMLVLMLKRPGRRSLALPAAGIRPADARPGWQPLPPVPPPVRALFRAVRIRGATCELLVRDAAVRETGHLVKRALTGWLDRT